MWSRLVSLRYDGSKAMKEHIVKMVNLSEKLGGQNDHVR